jgi:hypothetical protein
MKNYQSQSLCYKRSQRLRLMAQIGVFITLHTLRKPNSIFFFNLSAQRHPRMKVKFFGIIISFFNHLQKLFTFFFHKYVKMFQNLTWLFLLIILFHNLIPLNQRQRHIVLVVFLHFR